MNTPQTWSGIGFEVEITGDGSPSLRLIQGEEKGEAMHHSGGAAEETELIYGRIIHHCFGSINTPHFISVGLGLGYVELTVTREALLKKNFNFTMDSFELVPELRDFFIQWLKNGDLPQEIQAVYDQVLKYILKDSTLDPQELKNLLSDKYMQKQCVLHGPLDHESVFTGKAHGILFDAFSAKTTPALWTEEFLVDFFKKTTAEDALVSTYASRATLKQALKAADFFVENREGFKGKRNSTVAFKGLFKPTSEPRAGTSSHTQ
ncbi:MnmC family methyltransferase [Bdellovibrio sp. HCB337]|uniref:MnmC family methyltransferase n=1 Tax=Bdellovibrio sp. HCB337 TaxID=3394358 RepID=UPI0039A73616